MREYSNTFQFSLATQLSFVKEFKISEISAMILNKQFHITFNIVNHSLLHIRFEDISQVSLSEYDETQHSEIPTLYRVHKNATAPLLQSQPVLMANQPEGLDVLTQSRLNYSRWAHTAHTRDTNGAPESGDNGDY